MKTLSLKTEKIKGMFDQLHQNLGGTLNVDSKEHILNINNEIGTGSIKGITFKGGISYLEFDMEFSENFSLIINNPENAPICFAYCSEGNLSHSFGTDGEKRKLENFQTGILTSRSLEKNILYFEKDIHLRTTLIVVNTTAKIKDAESKSLNHKLQKLFLKDGTAENFAYIGSYNLKIAEKIQQLNAITQDGIVRNLLIEGLVYMILALEIQQHTDDVQNANRRTGSLNSREMESVRELSEFIQNYPERQLSVSELCRRSGLSPSKLQEGFKLMQGTTVTDYIREVRVRKAEDLIKNTDLNISEVVYSIGFTSRSYFSKIFKAKYKCSPKQYKDKQQAFAVSA